MRRTPTNSRFARGGRRGRNREHRRGSLGKRLLAVYIVASLLSIALTGGTLRFMLDRHAPIGIARELDEQSRWFERHLQFDGRGQPVALDKLPDNAWVYDVMTLDMKYWIVNANGVTVLASDPATPPFAPSGGRFDGGRKSFDVVDRGILLHVSTAALAHGGKPFYVQTAVSERSSVLFRRAIIGPLMRNALSVSLLALALFAVGMHFTLKHMLKPLREASEAASRIAPGNLAARLATETMPREMQPLTEAFNLALDRLEKGYRVQQEFLASAAHELKTPLTLIRGQVELNQSQDHDMLLRDIDLMARQIQQLLHLAEVSEVTNYAFEPIDIGAVTCEAANMLQRLAQRTGVYVDVRSPVAPVERQADRGAVFALLKNLIENAIHHSPQDAVVTVDVAAAGVTVRDEGAGIAPEHLDKLFIRFWRSTHRRDTGAGLGLAICAEVALAHDWQLTAANGDAGAVFTLAFDHA